MAETHLDKNRDWRVLPNYLFLLFFEERARNGIPITLNDRDKYLVADSKCYKDNDDVILFIGKDGVGYELWRLTRHMRLRG